MPTYMWFDPRDNPRLDPNRGKYDDPKYESPRYVSPPNSGLPPTRGAPGRDRVPRGYVQPVGDTRKRETRRHRELRDLVTGPGVSGVGRPGNFTDIMGFEPSEYTFTGGKGSDYPAAFGKDEPYTQATNYEAPIGLRNKMLDMIYGTTQNADTRLETVGRGLSGFQSNLFNPQQSAARSNYLQNYSRDIGYNPLLTNIQAQSGDVLNQVLSYNQQVRQKKRQRKTYLDLAGTITPGPVGQIVSGAGAVTQGKG